MTRVKLLVVIVFIILIKMSWSGVITPFTENNSIKVFDNKLYVATHLSSPHMIEDGYIYCLDLSSDTWSLHSFSYPILSIANSTSSLWLGTYGGGLIEFKSDVTRYYYLQNTGNHQKGQKDGLISNYINSIVTDSNNVYCATTAGLSIYNPKDNKWLSYDSQNSPLHTNYLFDIDIFEDSIWLTSSNYWYVYYEEGAADNEKGDIAQFNIKTNEWTVYTGTRRQFNSNHAFLPVPGDIPVPNSSFTNITIDSIGNIYFSYQGGIGVFDGNIWKVISDNPGRMSDITGNEEGLWTANMKSIAKYNYTQDNWTTYKCSEETIPGTVITSVCADGDSVWIKSYNPNIGYIEYLTLFQNNKWKSWNLTKMLKEELSK